MHKLLSDRKTIFLLMTPGFLLVSLLIFVPIGLAFYYSLTNWSGVGAYSFVGFEHYIAIFADDPVFWRSLRNSVLLGLGLTLLQHPLAIFIAMLIQYCGRYERWLQVCIFIPAIISTFVTTKLWTSIFDTQFGLLNRVLEGVGLGAWRQDWLGEPSWAMVCIVFVCMWQGFGYAFLLYFAGIKGISKDLHEAAMLDGATQRQWNARIVFPLLAPVIRVNLVLAVVAAFKQMETVYLLTGGGPANATHFMSTYLYSKAFRESMYGYGNAISILLVVVCLGVTVLMNNAMNREAGESA